MRKDEKTQEELFNTSGHAGFSLMPMQQPDEAGEA
jgi:hypothetical protein